MAPTRGGRDVERGGQYFPPGVVVDMEGNPLGTPEGLGLDMTSLPTSPARPARPPRRPGIIARGLRGLGNRLLGNG
jgi:hypothetical protein